MTPTAVLILVVGVLVVLAVAGTALALDARRRGARSAPPHPAPPAQTPYPTPPAARQIEPIDTVRAQEDPPTVLTATNADDEHPTVAVPREVAGEVVPDVDPDGDAEPDVVRRYGPGQEPGR